MSTIRQQLAEGRFWFSAKKKPFYRQAANGRFKVMAFACRLPSAPNHKFFIYDGTKESGGQLSGWYCVEATCGFGVSGGGHDTRLLAANAADLRIRRSTVERLSLKIKEVAAMSQEQRRNYKPSLLPCK